MMMAGQSARTLRAKRITSRPETSGMAKSVRMRSNFCGSRSSRPSASAPPPALTTLQPYMHGGSAVDGAFDAQSAARLLGETIDGAQAQPRALADILGGEERFDDL